MAAASLGIRGGRPSRRVKDRVPRRAASMPWCATWEAAALMAELVDDGAGIRPCAPTAASRTLAALGGYVATSPMRPVSATTWAYPTGCWASSSRTLSGGQRRRVEVGADPLRRVRRRRQGSTTTLLLDEPTNHLDADSITWLRSFLQNTRRRPDRDQPRRRPARRRPSTKCGSSMPCAARPTFTIWAGWQKY